LLHESELILRGPPLTCTKMTSTRLTSRRPAPVSCGCRTRGGSGVDADVEEARGACVRRLCVALPRGVRAGTDLYLAAAPTVRRAPVRARLAAAHAGADAGGRVPEPAGLRESALPDLSARRLEPRLRRRASRKDPRLREPRERGVDADLPRPDRGRRFEQPGDGAARAGVRSRLRGQRLFLRELHGERRGVRGRQRTLHEDRAL